MNRQRSQTPAAGIKGTASASFFTLALSSFYAGPQSACEPLISLMKSRLALNLPNCLVNCSIAST
jgi:hypothetical protein